MIAPRQRDEPREIQLGRRGRTGAGAPRCGTRSHPCRARLIALLAVLAVSSLGGCMRTPVSPARESRDLTNPGALNSLAAAHHNRGQLQAASETYRHLLKLEPPAAPSAEQRERALRYTPRLFVTPTEYFPLEDAVAVLHPTRPLVGYHLFWGDDIDYPGDGEPSDHEVIWVAYDQTSLQVTAVYAYFHGHLLTTMTAAADANRHHGRPWIGVQWGKHGSLLLGWEALDAESIAWAMHDAYDRLREEGRLDLDHPSAQDWPRRFAGSWDEFVDFSIQVDPRPSLGAEGRILVSRWPNAAIDRDVLAQPFCPKIDWPPRIGDQESPDD